MVDMPKCEECGGDLISVAIKDGKRVCGRCAGVPMVSKAVQDVTEPASGIERFMQQHGLGAADMMGLRDI